MRRDRPAIAGGGGVGKAPSSPRSLPGRMITLVGAAGGQGTTTVACALTALSAAHQPTVILNSQPRTAAAVLGVPAMEEATNVASNLWLGSMRAGRTPAITIVDGGRLADCLPAPGERYVVLRGPCYVALAGVLERGAQGLTGVVLVAEQGRALTDKDVSDVLGLPVVATVTASPTVARTIDAGLLLNRVHRLREFAALRRLVEPALNPSRALPKEHTDLPLSRGDNGGGRRRCRVGPSQGHVWGAWKHPGVARSRVEHRPIEPRRCRLLPR